MISNAGAAPGTARVIYPELPDPLTAEDLQRLFRPSADERKWVPTIARTPASQVGLMVQLKIFQTIGRFRRVSDIPAVVFEYVADQLGVELGSAFVHPDRSLYRHRPAVLKRLGVTGCGAAARELARSAMMTTAKTRTDPAVDFSSPCPIRQQLMSNSPCAPRFTSILERRSTVLGGTRAAKIPVVASASHEPLGRIEIAMRLGALEL